MANFLNLLLLSQTQDLRFEGQVLVLKELLIRAHYKDARFEGPSIRMDARRHSPGDGGSCQSAAFSIGRIVFQAAIALAFITSWKDFHRLVEKALRERQRADLLNLGEARRIALIHPAPYPLMFNQFNRKRLLGVAILLLTLMAGCGKKPNTTGAAGKSAPVPVNVGKAIKKEMPFDLRAIGNVEAISTVDIKAQVGGELVAVNFAEGQEVKKGDLLFSIQPKLYATQMAQAEANLARDRAQAANARREATRSVELGSKGAVSKEQLEQSHAQAEALESTVKADEAMLEIARVQLGYTSIRSPIDGRTGALQVQAGNLIKASADTAMVTVNQIAPIYVSFALPEQFLTELRNGMAAREIKVTALNPRDNTPLAEGRLTFINNSVDMATGTIVLKATFSNEDHALWPGAYVDAVLHLSMESDAIVVPTSAISIGQAGQQIYVIKADGTAELRNVTVTRAVGQESIIKTGVQADETIVVNGQSRLVPGAKVEIKPV
ncbi:MAG: efflux transporter, family, subunit [Chthoniobacteraceae bacterium]|nr:efflux transporter, family, subunit [Chthoniobacteraceae bacterium]